METNFSYNDWRYYSLAHASKYDWSTGKNPSDYNHDYYEAHKEEILGKRKNGVRDFGGAGVGYKAKKDGTYGLDESDYENDEDWSDELTPEEIENIKKHNEQVEANIANLTKTVESYISANKGKLSNEQISKLRSDLNTQISIAREQKVNTKNSDDYNYIMDLRKQSGASKASSTPKPAAQPTRSSSRSNTSSSSGSKKQEEKKEQEFKNASDLKRYDYEQMQKNNTTNPTNSPDYENEARQRQQQQANIRAAGKSSSSSTQSGPVSRQVTYSDDEERKRAERTGRSGGGRVGSGSNRYGR